MAEGTIDRLEIEIKGTSSEAAKSIRDMANALGRLDAKLSSPTTKLAAFSSALGGVKNALAGFDVSKIQALGTVKISSTVHNNITKIGEALGSLDGSKAASINSIGTALSSLSGFKLSTASVTQLERMPKVLSEWSKLDVRTLATDMSILNAQLSQLAGTVGRFSTSYKTLPDSMRGAARAARSVTQANEQLAKSTEKVNKKLDTFKSVISAGMIHMGLLKLGQGIAYSMAEVSNYIESMNLFAASMGEAAEAASDYAKTVQDAMGIDAGEWSRFQGVVMSLGTGFGITADRAAYMSQQMTQLGYDISSFYNLDINEAMRKVQSGFAGELEPMRRIGYDLSVARMQIEATNLGIEKNVSEMTQAEKAALRYYLMMTQLTQVHGDMARTLNSPANQLRVLKAQFTQAARAIGNLFIPALNAILPYVIGAVKAIRMLAQEIANFFGLDVNFEVDYSSLDTSGIAGGAEELADGLGDAGDAASDAKERVDELKRSVMGFDELNKLSAASSAAADADTGADAGANMGSVLDQIPLEGYDFLTGLDDRITEMSDRIAEKLKELMPIIAAIAAGLLGLGIGSKLWNDLPRAIGLAMTLAGAVLLVTGLFDAWNNGFDLNNMMQSIGGLILLVGGLGLAFGAPAAAIGAVIGGLAMFVTAVRDAVNNGLSSFNGMAAFVGGLAASLGLMFFNPVLGGIAAIIGGLIMLGLGIQDLAANGITFENLTWLMGGLTLAVVGLTVVFGPVAGAIALVIGSVGLLIAAFMDFFQNGATEENMTAIGLAIIGIGAAIALLTGSPIALLIGAFIGAIAIITGNWDSLKEMMPEPVRQAMEKVEEILGPALNWIGENIIKPLGAFFTDVWTLFSGSAEEKTAAAERIQEGFKDTIKGIAEAIGGFFANLWQGVKDAAKKAADWVGDRFGELREWFKTNVTDKIFNFFKEKFDAIGNKAKEIKDGIVNYWKGVAEWWKTNVTDKVHNFFKEKFDAIRSKAKDVKDKVHEAWDNTGEWFRTNVTDKVSGFFGNLFDGINKAQKDSEQGIRDKWGAVKSWMSDNVVAPLATKWNDFWADAQKGGSDAWTAIKDTFSSVGKFFSDIFGDAWEGLKGIFTSGGAVFEGVVDAIANAFKDLANVIIDGLNWAIAQPFDGINGIFDAMRGWEVFGQYIFSWLPWIDVPYIPYLARGGLVNDGQLFVARERGPELVGTMGSRTAVANNDQIVSGISRGVADAFTEVLAMQQGVGGSGTTEVVLVVGSEELARAVYKGNVSLARRGEIQFSEVM